MKRLEDAVVQRAMEGLVQTLADARRYRGMSQTELAGLLGVSTPTIVNWESERSLGPTAVYLVAWARQVGKRVVIVGDDGDQVGCPVAREPGEDRDSFEAWQLTRGCPDSRGT